MADLAEPPTTVIRRSELSLGVDSSLRGRLARLAAGRVLTLDYFASRRCSVTVGDMTADFSVAPPGAGFAALARIEGVPVFVERRLLPVLREGIASLSLAGPTFARHLAVRLERPERWLDFLEEPGAMAGKRGFRLGRRRPGQPAP